MTASIELGHSRLEQVAFRAWSALATGNANPGPESIAESRNQIDDLFADVRDHIRSASGSDARLLSPILIDEEDSKQLFGDKELLEDLLAGGIEDSKSPTQLCCRLSAGI
jgi:hypothetical protein